MTSGVFPGYFPGDIEGVLQHYGPRARVVVLWRRQERRSKQWLYLGRLAPDRCELHLLQLRFGGGWYRAKIYGDWDPEKRREEYLQQVTLLIDGPIGPETIEWMRAAEFRRRRRRSR